MIRYVPAAALLAVIFVMYVSGHEPHNGIVWAIMLALFLLCQWQWNRRFDGSVPHANDSGQTARDGDD